MPSRHPLQPAACAALSIAFVLAACGSDPSPRPASKGGIEAVAAIVSRGAIDGMPVIEAKGRAAKGQEVSITGRIGGSDQILGSIAHFGKLTG